MRKFFAMAALLLPACSDLPTQAERDVDPPQYNYVDVSWDDVSGDADVAHVDGSAGAYPDWNGWDPAVSGLPPGSPPAVCPGAVGVVMMLSTVSHGTFVIVGVFVKTNDIGTRNGWPTARYSVPATDHPNMEATYVINGGYIWAECQGTYFNSGFSRVWAGNLHPYHYDGSAKPSNQGSTNNDQGWAFDDADQQNGSTTGDGSWQNVLNAYLEDGTCTPGWAVFVDDVLVCAP